MKAGLQADQKAGLEAGLQADQQAGLQADQQAGLQDGLRPESVKKGWVTGANWSKNDPKYNSLCGQSWCCDRPA